MWMGGICGWGAYVDGGHMWMGGICGWGHMWMGAYVDGGQSEGDII